MKKNIVNLVLLFIFIILISFYLIMKVIKPFEVSKSIFRIKEGNISKINIKSLNTVITFYKKDNQWVMVKPDEYKIDEKKVVALERILNNLKQERIIEKEVSDFSIYGLDKPKLEISIKFNNGENQDLIIGEMSLEKSQYYAVKRSSKENEKNVFTISKGYVDFFFKDVSYFRDNTLMSVDIAKVKILYLINSKNEEIKLIKNTNNEWEFSLPVKAMVKGDALVEIMNKLRQLEIVDYISVNNNELDKYGLINFSAKLILEDEAGNNQTISFGKNIDNKLFVRSDNENEIYSISSALFKPDDIKIGELLNVAPLSVGIDSVNKIVINDAGTIYEFKRDEIKSVNSFFINGREVDNELFNSLYVNIMALSAEGYDQNIFNVKPDFSITLESKKEPKKIMVGFTKRTRDSYFISLNENQLPFFIGERKIEVVKRFLNRIVEYKKS